MEFFERFQGKAFLPVIHVEGDSLKKTLANAEIAFNEGADGVFLINHGESGTGDAELLQHHYLLQQIARGEWRSNFWVGVNCLTAGSLCPAVIFDALAPDVDGLWIDSIDVGPKKTSEQNNDELLRARTKSGWKGLLFGGVAFKYQRPVEFEHLPSVAKRATKYVDVVTTSGDATGEAPDIAKIRVMKEAIGNFPLAIASGITAGNVHRYLPYTDAFLVATSISKSFTELDPMLVRAMRKAINA